MYRSLSWSIMLTKDTHRNQHRTHGGSLRTSENRWVEKITTKSNSCWSRMNSMTMFMESILSLVKKSKYCLVDIFHLFSWETLILLVFYIGLWRKWSNQFMVFFFSILGVIGVTDVIRCYRCYLTNYKFRTSGNIQNLRNVIISKIDPVNPSNVDLVILLLKLYLMKAFRKVVSAGQTKAR